MYSCLYACIYIYMKVFKNSDDRYAQGTAATQAAAGRHVGFSDQQERISLGHHSSDESLDKLEAAIGSKFRNTLRGYPCLDVHCVENDSSARFESLRGGKGVTLDGKVDDGSAMLGAEWRCVGSATGGVDTDGGASRASHAYSFI